MKYSYFFIQLIEGLKKKEKYSVRNLQIDFDGNIYKMIISILDFGQRIEIRKDDEEYIIYLQGIDGLGSKAVIHQKNSKNIIKMLKRITQEQLEEIIHTTNEIENSVLRRSIKIHKMEVENTFIPKKTKKEIQIQIDRLLDRYNDYMFLYHNSLLTDEKYKRRAAKLMRLLNKIKLK